MHGEGEERRSTVSGAIVNGRHFRWAACLFMAGMVGPAVASDDEESRGFFSRSKELAPVSLKAYQDECSSCHFAYQPALLPEGSWRKLLAPKALTDHFGENIEMKEALRTSLLDYAVANAAERSSAKRARKIVASLDGATPLRISEIPYIRRKHQEIPEEQLAKNPKVGSIALCDACHTEAIRGNFDDDTVVIPGFGRWRW